MQSVVTTSCNNRLYNRLVVVFTLCSMLRQLLCQLLLDRLHLATGCCNRLYNHVVQSVCATPTPLHNDVTYVIAVCCSTIFVCVFWEYYAWGRRWRFGQLVYSSYCCSCSCYYYQKASQTPATSPATVVTIVVINQFIAVRFGPQLHGSHVVMHYMT